LDLVVASTVLWHIHRTRRERTEEALLLAERQPTNGETR
jgi:hypothetical protein